MQKGQRWKSHITASPNPPPPLHLSSGGEIKILFSKQTALLHLFPCCGKSTQTGLDPKQGQLQNAEILQPGRTRGLLRPPSPSTFDFNYVGTCLGRGGCWQNSPGPAEGGLVLQPKIFPKSPHRISRLLPTLHFVFGQIPGSLEPEKL